METGETTWAEEAAIALLSGVFFGKRDAKSSVIKKLSISKPSANSVDFYDSTQAEVVHTAGFMSSLLSKLNLAAGIATLALTLCLIGLNSTNRDLQGEAQSQVFKIRTGQQTQQITSQVATNIVKDLAKLSLGDQQIRSLLQKHGFTVQVRQPAAPAAAPANK